MFTENLFKRRLRESASQIGIWSCVADPILTELVASIEFDWILLDGEHTPSDARAVALQLQAVAAYPTQAIVRPPVGDAVHIKQLLDVGAQTLLIPMVDSAAQAQMVAESAAFPPTGIRGVASLTRASRWGLTSDYLHSARDGICVIVQIESVTAVENVDEIARVEGVDAIFIGPADLAASLGHLGDPAHAEVQQAVSHVADRAHAAGKPVGTLTSDLDLAATCVASGFDFVGVGVDTSVLRSALHALRTKFEKPDGVRAAGAKRIVSLVKDSERPG
jgi:4-hydroxy-2-oxoheptanedioate aldolase